MGFPDRTWEDPEQPLIFTIGPLTGYFPLMSKVVCAFKSPYHDQFAESHGGGRSALSMRFADLDALVLTGKARRPSCLVVGSRTLELKDVHYLWGKSVQRTGQMLRRIRRISRMSLAPQIPFRPLPLFRTASRSPSGIPVALRK
jgi:aldehyde:ferredoxin oxidoreductase